MAQLSDSSSSVISRSCSVPNVATKVPDISDGETSITRYHVMEPTVAPAELPVELILKHLTQAGRLEALQTLNRQLPSYSSDTTLEEVCIYRAQVDELHQAFIEQLAYLESSWPISQLNHEYFSSKMFLKESQCTLMLELKLSKLKVDLESSHQSHAPSTPSIFSQLQEITLASFKGDFTQWPAYSERFSSLVLTNSQFTDSQKLHHLRSTLQGDPSHLVESSSLNFEGAWKLLTATYKNKRSVIRSLFNKLISVSPITTPCPEALKALSLTVTKAKNELTSLMAAAKLGDSVLCYHLSQKLDCDTRNAWENSIDSSSDYPQFDTLVDFIAQRVRELESIEAQPPLPTSSHSTTLRSAYPCDCCEANHLIVVCTKFRQMTIKERRGLITRKLLCRNCCSRHATAHCKSSLRCKHCKAEHHTMLHVGGMQPKQQPYHWLKNQPGSSTHPLAPKGYSHSSLPAHTDSHRTQLTT